MVTKERLEEMQGWFWAETNDPESEEWREELTPEEAAIVEAWDNNFFDGLSTMAQDILNRMEGR